MMNYQDNLSKKELNYQLLVGLKKHLILAQTTNLSKLKRIRSLDNLGEVLEYICLHINDAISAEEQSIFARFFTLLLTKVTQAKSMIHQTPLTFEDEIGFISIMIAIK